MTVVSVKEIVCKPSAKVSAFSRVDLLAVIVVFILISATVLPSVARVTGKTTIAQCAANLMQYDVAMQIYGNENQDQLPVNMSGAWPWDMSTRVSSYITNTGVKWNNLYCPGTSSRFTEQDNLRLFNYEPGSLSVLGYASTIPGTATFSGVFVTNLNASLTIQRVRAFLSGEWLPVNPATRVLVADGVLTSSGSSSNYALMRQYNWTTVFGGYVNAYGQPLPHLCGHLNGTIPLGGNVGMLDGHVEWRSFSNMLPRCSSSPTFYW